MTETHNPIAIRQAADALSGDLAKLILQVWQRTRVDWAPSDHLSSAFRADRRWSATDRRFAGEVVYGMIRQLRRLDEALLAGGLRSADRAPDRQRLLAYLLIEQGLSLEEALRHEPAIRWADAAAVDERIARVRSLPARVALRHSLPDWLAGALVSDFGDAAEALAAALNQRASTTLRANTLVMECGLLTEKLRAAAVECRPGRFGPWAVQVVGTPPLISTDLYRRGAFELQDEASQLVAELAVPPQDSALVVDYCAGAGGKSLALAAAMGNRGRVVAVDVDRRRLAELRRRARRAGCNNIQGVTVTAAGDSDALSAIAGSGGAARVLVDAPCTGVGVLRRKPESRWRLQRGDVDRMAATQLAIAERACELVAPGGLLVYATCSLLSAENQAVVDQLLAGGRRLELVPIAELLGSRRADKLACESPSWMQTRPDRHDLDGFTAFVLRRPAA